MVVALAGNALIDATQPNQKAMKTDKTTTSSPDSTDADVVRMWRFIAQMFN